MHYVNVLYGSGKPANNIFPVVYYIADAAGVALIKWVRPRAQPSCADGLVGCFVHQPIYLHLSLSAAGVLGKGQSLHFW